jgi:predicted nuclease of predicted toxin-antitoxin system
MTFLIDECLHTSLVHTAHEAGYAAMHIFELGLLGWKDHQIAARLIEDGLTFVTNNGPDFLPLLGRREIHAGLIIIIPNIIPAKQRELFCAALVHARGRDLTNIVIESGYSESGRDIVCREYTWPFD